MIFYFSGTGNSLTTAKRLAEQLNDQVMAMNTALKFKDEFTNKRIGFVFPVYFYDVPKVVEKFIEKLELASGYYFYAIATCGGEPGNALHSVRELFFKKGLELSYAKAITLPDNTATLLNSHYDLTTLKFLQNTIEQIASDILLNTENTAETRYKYKAKLLNITTRKFAERELSKKQADETLCVQCHICEKICPAKNIRLIDGKVNIGNSCDECLACVHWCPQAAIRFNKRSISIKQQYHHPDIALQDMINS